MPTVVFDVAAAVPTGRNWNAGPLEGLWLALRVIEERIMRGIEPPRNRQRCLHVNCDPVPEGHAFVAKVVAQLNVPLGEVVQVQRPSFPKYSNSGSDPIAAPRKVRILADRVIHL